ncbi:SnoaL-like domain-containing protein [Lampropedia hyalina DSM 16112]|jgi:tetratricopeptide (TPR) repeat protein|uniref:SnoaL-like domain-containing protein n=1 Tax=Lampropedia hyalina DSM 16112 TaxID=1122156 RepID=A0A1M4TXJ4_9BURK|nr:tetratricopeptide repeat protein [Lampropedia hyalina]SHE49201.1 SnoaL-like domain-containing protein [Lampropedia hyalina DSM 16112]
MLGKNLSLRLSARGRSRLLCHALVALLGVSGGMGSVAASTVQQSVFDEVSRLLEQGQLDVAERRVAFHLQSHPEDVQVRFLQGVIATEQGHNVQAIDIFTRLTHDYPSLPEPFNNLAVLYAASGDERKATEILEAAIRTNPSYATAHENLGDLYARRASAAYAKALQLDDSRQTLAPKLSVITQIFTVQEGGMPQTWVASAGRTTAAAPAPVQEAAAPAPVVVADATAPVTEPLVIEEMPDTQVAAAPAQPAVPVAAPSVPEPVAEPVQVAIADVPATEITAPAAVEPVEVLPPAEPVLVVPAEPAVVAVTEAPATPVVDAEPAVDASFETQVAAAVEEWVDAWSNRDLNRYLAAYSENFRPADGTSLARWKAQREQRIVGRNSITVAVRNIDIVASADRATVTFRQDYSSDAYSDTMRKELRLRNENGQWRIVHEGAAR